MRLNNLLLHKITLFTLAIATTSMPSYGMMPRLRLVLDKGLTAAAAHHSTLKPSVLAPALHHYSRQNNALALRFLSSKNSESKDKANFKFLLPLATSVGIIGSTSVALCQDLSAQEKQDQELVLKLLNDPSSFSEAEQCKLIATHKEYTIDLVTKKSVRISSNLSNSAKKIICEIIIEQGITENIAHLVYIIPEILSPEDQASFVKNYSASILSSFHIQTIFKQWAENAHKELASLITTQASEKQAVACVLANPGFFPEDQQCTIITQHIDLIISDVRHYNLTELSEWSDKAKALLSNGIIKQMPTIEALQLLLSNPNFFTEEQQHAIILKDICSLHSLLLKYPSNYAGLYPSSKELFLKTISSKGLLLKALAIFLPQEQIDIFNLYENEIFAMLEHHNEDLLAHDFPDNLKLLVGTLIFNKGSENQIIRYFKNYPSLFSEQQRKIIIHKILEQQSLYNPLEKEAQEGPLFSSYLEKRPEQFFAFLKLQEEDPNFYNLLPAIRAQVEYEYANDRIVLFHGQRANWMLLEKLYNRLESLNQTIEYPNFIHLRFQKHSDLSEDEVQEIRKNGKKRESNGGIQNDPILFTNLHPSANSHQLDNSWDRAIHNHDLSADNLFEVRLQKIFENLNLFEEYKALNNKSPKIFLELYQLFSDAIREQGNHGRLLAISMPAELAKKITYATDYCAIPNPCRIKDQTTTDTAEIARNYNHVACDNQFALILSEEIINPEAAAKAGVKIVGFDPAFYWQTEKSQKVLKKLDEIIELIRKIKEKHASAKALLGFLQRETP